MRIFLIVMFGLGAPAWAAKSVTMEIGDLANGTALIKAHCGGCDSKVLHDPMALVPVGELAIRTALRRGAGVGPLAGWDGTRLHDLETWDVIRYLRQHSISLADLLPTATHFSVEETTPNEWGRDRLHRQARIFKAEPTPKQVTGKVLVFWEVAGAQGLRNVSGDTSIIGGFERNQKKGFVLLRRLKIGKKTVQMGLALDRESLKVTAARAVPGDGSKANAALRAVRRGCLGKGRRDNYQRFTCGRTGALARPIWNAFILGAEQIYAYEIVERENDFGSDFDETTGDSESSQ